MDCSTPGLPVLHYITKHEFAQTHVHWVSDAIQLFHPLFSSSPLALIFPSLIFFPMSQIFVSSDQSTGASASAPVFAMTIQGWFPVGLTGLISLLSRGLSRVFSSTTIWMHQFFSAHLFYCPDLTSIHDYGKKPSFD